MINLYLCHLLQAYNAIDFIMFIVKLQWLEIESLNKCWCVEKKTGVDSLVEHWAVTPPPLDSGHFVVILVISNNGNINDTWPAQMVVNLIITL